MAVVFIRMKKIILFIPNLKSGGAERVCSVLANYFSNYFEVIIYTNETNSIFYKLHENIKIKDLRFKYNTSITNRLYELWNRIKKITAILKEEKPDCILSFLTGFNILFSICSIISIERPWSLFLCEHNNYYACKPLLKRAFRNCLYFLSRSTVTVLTERDVENYPRFIRDKIVVMENPLGIELTDMEYEHYINSRMPLISSSIKLLAVGRLTKQKGYERLISIMAKLNTKCDLPWSLYIYGDGELESYITDLISISKLEGKVILSKPVKNLTEIYMRSDIFLMTSHWEGLPMVIGEALNHGLPVVAYDCPTGPREFVVNAINGFLIENGDEDMFLSSVLSLMNNRELMQKQNYAARESSKKYSVSKVGKRWLSLINL